MTITYNGTSTNATGTLTITSSEVGRTVNLTASYNTGGGSTSEETIETWEGCSTGGYWTQTVQGHAFSWSFSDAGIWADTNSNGAQSCRFGKSSSSFIMMNEDLTNGASKVTFYAVNWNNDATPTVQVQYSTNGGSTWTTAGTCTLNSTWKQYSFDMNVTGNVRFKIAQTAGSRFNIDDIAITSNNVPVANPQLTAPVDDSTVNVGTIAATGTSVSKTINVKGSDLTKALNLSVSGTGFSVSPASVSAASANNGVNVTVTYSSSVAGEATGTLTISSSEVSASVILTASKQAMATLTMAPLARIEAEQDGESSVVMGSVTSENNAYAITLSVEGNFELSLNQRTWSRTLTLAPVGEVFYVRLASTATAGDYYGSITATTGVVSASADVEGTVTAAPAVLVGDVDMNGEVGIGDVSTLIDHLLGSDPQPYDAAAADVDQNGSVDIADVSALIDMLLAPKSSLNSARWNAVPADGAIEISNPAGETLEVYDMDAQVVATIDCAGLHSVALPEGVYLVSGDSDSRKVVIK